jgi:hypothetical protein
MKLYDIIVIDNAIETDLANYFDKECFDTSFPWYVQRDSYIDKEDYINEGGTFINKNSFTTIQLVHGIYYHNEDPQIRSTLYSKVLDVMKQAIGNATNNTFNPVIIRAKINFLLNNTKSSYKEYNVPHVDNHFDNSYSGIYYVNDSDGDTIIFNEKCDDKFDINNLTIKKRITPRKNRFVLFDGDYYHTSSNPIHNEARVVINFNMANKNE